MRLSFLLLILTLAPVVQAQTNSVDPLAELNGPATNSAAAAAPTTNSTPATAPVLATNTLSASPPATTPAPVPTLPPTTNGMAPGAPPASPPAPDAATQSSPSVRILQQSAQLVRDGDLDGALKNLNALIQTDPKNVNAYVLRGQVYSQKKQPDLEAQDFQSAHALEPNNPVVNFDVAEVKFTQKSYDAARIGFAELAKDPSSLIGGLSTYKVFLCDLLGNHPDVASQEFDAINKIGSGAVYYYSNAAWDLVHHQTEDARGWLSSASQIYTPEKNTLYSRSLADLGFLPLPPPPSPQ